MQIKVLLIVSLFLITGCKHYPIQTYSIPKEKLKLPFTATTSTVLPFSWVLPKTWVPGELSSMRLADFKIADSSCEVTLVALPGGGDLLGNVNRWRGQLALPPIEGKDLQKLSHPFQHEAFDMTWVELYGKEKGIIAVIFDDHDQVYFIKVMGSVRDIKEERKTFEQFVKSFEHAH